MQITAPLLEIARFSDHVLKNKDQNCIDLVWADPRDISLVHVVFEPSFVYIGTPSLISGVYYWKYNWPEKRPQAIEGSGQSGWEARDDWYKGSWKAADITSTRHPGVPLTLSFTFKPIASKDYPVTFRRSLKLRIQFNKKIVDIDKVKDIRVYTTTLCAPTSFSICVDPGWIDVNNMFTATIWNGYFTTNDKPIEDLKVGSAFDTPVTLLAALPSEPWSFDCTQVTIWIPGRKPFTFAMDDLVRQGYIFVPAMHVLVRAEGSLMLFNQAWSDIKSRQAAATHEHPGTPETPALLGKSVYDRLFDLPEQKLDRALENFKGKHLMHFILGCEGVRSKCALSIAGSIHSGNRFIKRVERSDTPRAIWKKAMLKIAKVVAVDDEPAGLDLSTTLEKRHLLDGYIPVMVSTWKLPRGVVLEQEAYATLLRGTVVGQRPIGDDDIVVMEKLTLKNESTTEHVVSLSLVFGESDSINDASLPDPLFENITLQPAVNVAGRVLTLSTSSGKEYRCMVVPGDESMILSGEQDKIPSLELKMILSPGSSKSANFKLPMLAIDAAAVDKHLSSLDHEGEKLKVVSYWRNRLSSAASIEVPSTDFNDFYKAHLYHVLVTNDRDVNSDLVFGRVGSLVYGTFANEVCMVTMDLDRRGLHDEAKNILEVFIKYQGTKGLLGDYDGIDGIFFGADGYENGEGYNQNHGFVLWAMVEHVRLSGDVDWFKRNALAVIKGCDWIARERRIFDESMDARKAMAFKGMNEVYRGLLPPGGVEDVQDFWFWLSTNAYNCFGMAQAASMLEAIAHPDSPRIVAEAAEYVASVKKAFESAMRASPVVALRDGTFVPHYPCRLPCRGRGYGWIQETLEGAVHLLRTWIVNPFSSEAAFIMKDYEDNLFLSEKYGYPIVGDEFEKRWFSTGGFSQQPFLLCNPWPYGMRGNTKHYLRAVLNAFSVNYRSDTRTFCEHPLPGLLDVRGDFFKTSDEANFCGCLRDMLVQETIASVDEVLEGWEGNPDQHPNSDAMETLHALGSWDRMDGLRVLYHVPREWLSNGKEIHARGLPTYFGKVDVDMVSKTGDGRVDVNVSIDRSTGRRVNPRLKAVFIKIRHPDLATNITHLVLEQLDASKEGAAFNQVQPSFVRDQAFGIGLIARLTPSWTRVVIRARVFFREPRPEELVPSTLAS
ncbi:MAG: hypothetical protein Q6373_021045 [Candidatus Sigynarchaeota archaeon]